jgi:Tfp pilus assembly protein PilN
LALGATAGGWQIDLCPPVKRSFRFTGEMGRRLAAAAVVALVLVAALSTRSVMAVGQGRSRLAAQKKTNATVEAEIVHFDSLRRLNSDLDAGRRRVQSALAGDVSWTRFLDGLVRSMPSGVWLQSLTVQTTPTAGAASAAPAGGIGSLQVSATGLDYPAVADWLRKVAADPSLSGVAVGGLTSTPVGSQPTVTFTSTATITPAARSDRAAKLARAAL